MRLQQRRRPIDVLHSFQLFFSAISPFIDINKLARQLLWLDLRRLPKIKK
jgi:hypothetical protein